MIDSDSDKEKLNESSKICLGYQINPNCYQFVFNDNDFCLSCKKWLEKRKKIHRDNLADGFKD
jgi:hypothetical protein